MRLQIQQVVEPPSRNYSQYYGGSIPWVKSGELKDSIITTVEEFITTEGLKNSSAKVFQQGTALVAMYGATVGKTGILGLDAATNQAICAIFPLKEAFTAKFIIYWLQFQRQNLIDRSSGGAQPNINQETVRNFPLPLAPLSEQHRIVAALEQQFSRLDAGVAALKRAKAKLKRYRAAVLKAAVEGKLTESWRAEHPTTEPASQLLERILKERHEKWEADLRAKGKDLAKVKYVEPATPDVESLPELPKGWCWTIVDRIAQIQGGIQKQPSRTPKNNAFPYLRVANVFRGRLDLTNIEKMELFGNELNILRLAAGDLLIVEGNGSKSEIGRSALWQGEIQDCVHQNHIIRVRLSNIIPEYLDFYWNSPEGNQRVMDVAASTSGLYTLSVGKVSRLPVPLPPFAEQEQIVAEVERHLSLINQLEVTVDANLKRAERLRQSILREAFVGRLVPQDPTDEPASVLLERIRNERNGQQNGTGVYGKKSRSVRVPEPVTLDAVDAEQTELWESVGN